MGHWLRPMTHWPISISDGICADPKIFLDGYGEMEDGLDNKPA